MHPGLLADSELVAALTADPRLIDGIDVKEWKQENSHIQPCSIDLHVGRIFRPGEEDKARPGSPKARFEVLLETGQTAVIVTRETLNLTSDLAGVGFPPSHVSAKGLLMTNPGHVDPGYRGQLRFTVINMSAFPFPLKEGEIIVTLLLFRLANAVAANYTVRTGRALGDPSWDEVNRLSKDFVKVEARALRIARRVSWKWTAGISVGVGLITFFGAMLERRLSGIDALSTKVAALEERIAQVKLEDRIVTLEKTLNDQTKASKK